MIKRIIFILLLGCTWAFTSWTDTNFNAGEKTGLVVSDGLLMADWGSIDWDMVYDCSLLPTATGFYEFSSGTDTYSASALNGQLYLTLFSTADANHPHPYLVYTYPVPSAASGYWQMEVSAQVATLAQGATSFAMFGVEDGTHDMAVGIYDSWVFGVNTTSTSVYAVDTKEKYNIYNLKMSSGVASLSVNGAVAISSMTPTDLSDDCTMYFRLDTMDEEIEVYWDYIKYAASTQTAGYMLSGVYISDVYDTGEILGVDYSTITWVSDDDGGTIKFQIASSSNSNGPWEYLGADGNTDGYYTEPAIITPGHDGNRYVRYKAFFTADASSTTAYLSSVSIIYSEYLPPTVYYDIDGDGISEYVENTTGDMSNGYDKFMDPSSDTNYQSAVRIMRDGNGDGKNDFWITTISPIWNNHPDIYWSPHLGVVTLIKVTDVNDDMYDDYVYDKNGDGTYDCFLDGKSDFANIIQLGTLQGKVTSLLSGQLVAGAIVQVMLGDSVEYSTITDINGDYYIKFEILYNRGYVLYVKKDGYAPQRSDNLAFYHGQNVVENVALKPAAVALSDGIIVTPNPWRGSGMVNIYYNVSTERKNAAIRVYDLSGKLVDKIFDSKIVYPGAYTELWSPTLSNGLYYIVFFCDKEAYKCKFVIVR